MTKMRQMASEANLTMEQFQAMEGMIQATWKSAGDALRIKFQAMPLGITLMCTGFVQVGGRSSRVWGEVWCGT